MMPEFYLGQWVIDIRKQLIAGIVNIFEGGTKVTYLLETNDGDFYITEECSLIPYNKYYFDEVEGESDEQP